MTIAGIPTRQNSQCMEPSGQADGATQCGRRGGHTFTVVAQGLLQYRSTEGDEITGAIPTPFPGNLIKAGGRAWEATSEKLSACWGQRKNTGETPNLHDRIGYTAASQAMHLKGLSANEAIQKFKIESPVQQRQLYALDDLKSPLGQKTPNRDAPEQGIPNRGAHSLVG